MKINTDFELVSKIINGLKRNFEKYGEPYCPCRLDRTNDTICPCEDFKFTGKCKCGLFQ